MTTTIKELDNLFKSIVAMRTPRAEKIPLVKNIRSRVGEVEQAAAKDFSFPLDEIQKIKPFIMKLDDYLR